MYQNMGISVLPLSQNFPHDLKHIWVVGSNSDGESLTLGHYHIFILQLDVINI